ncbi:TPA: relaxase/mobilization nuclease domain-containing protein [Vibrio parahaemolyticus]|nr:relaxase/mobilization nuclease domain-containing protein [Vibrio parahaemolyticus]HCH5272887.1 relaxase/mobilization nuclease domain-containing protein [Vibrio parahaemolyticus]
MIVKFFKGDHSSVTNGLEYLEGGTKRRKIAPTLLSGNPDTTRELLKQASRFSKAFTYGCLSFEEENIPSKQKQELMESFEKTLMAGLEPEQYDIVWIEHRDKDRLELNFHIVNMELSTGKALTPYVHSRDVKRIDTWKCIANDTYGFSDPNDPLKARTFTLGDNPKPRRELMEQVDSYLFQLAADGDLNNQEDIINALNAIDGIEVTRNTKTSISFKADGHQKAIRLKGAIYGKDYGGIEDLEKQQAARAAKFRAERDKRLEANRQGLRERNQHLAKKRSEQYRKPETTKPSNTNTSSPSNTVRGDGVGSVPNPRIRDQHVPEVPTGSKRPEQSKTTVLPNQAPKTQINNHANNNINQPKSPAKWIRQLFERARKTIEIIAERAGERKAEAGELRKEYDATQRNCIELDRLLKGGKWGPTIARQQAFNQGGRPTPPPTKTKPQSPPQTKREPTKLRM